MKGHIMIYFFVLSIPLLLALNAWQAERYAELQKDVKKLEASQEEWLESNKRLIAGIAVLSSPERIEHIASHELQFEKIHPESVLQIRIEGE
ncbi:MAG: cell division protein FtsL [Treponema sp.]|nr:cell division protein FtsL [Treponema sp.]